MISGVLIRILFLIGGESAWATAQETPPSTLAIRPIKIVFLGDSLTEGYGVSALEAFPALVEKRLQDLGFKVGVVNSGISGSTSASAPSRMRWILKGKPDWVILALGANDALRGLKVEETRKSLDEALTIAGNAHVQVLLVGMKVPPNYGKDYSQRFEEVFPVLARKHQVPLLPFLLAGVAGDRSLNQTDQIHPNAAGHRHVADSVVKALLPLLKNDRPH